MGRLSDGAKIAIGIVLAGLLIAVAVFLRPVPDRYRVEVRNGEVRRIDTATGEVLACKGSDCGTLREVNGKLEVR